ncbi:hypothetical protein PMZ80_005064 [Knufia obscura]|uniref:Uncharacterized protein n=2 Tax=Knufia TaxID=430999 RepID=A0AAN8IBM4_9EURO|nr:hypothetical protein PMZ80_005064 [Knufia obscura]KAK5957726.1 hypothetical protein OHC33_000915 [Knufia fluminis]
MDEDEPNMAATQKASEPIKPQEPTLSPEAVHHGLSIPPAHLAQADQARSTIDATEDQDPNAGTQDPEQSLDSSESTSSTSDAGSDSNSDHDASLSSETNHILNITVISCDPVTGHYFGGDAVSIPLPDNTTVSDLQQHIQRQHPSHLPPHRQHLEHRHLSLSNPNASLQEALRLHPEHPYVRNHYRLVYLSQLNEDGSLSQPR